MKAPFGNVRLLCRSFQQFSSAPGLHSSPSKTKAMQLPSSLSSGGNLWNIYGCLGRSCGHLTPHPNQLIKGFFPTLHYTPWDALHLLHPTDVLVSLVSCSLLNCLQWALLLTQDSPIHPCSSFFPSLHQFSSHLETFPNSPCQNARDPSCPWHSLAAPVAVLGSVSVQFLSGTQVSC